MQIDRDTALSTLKKGLPVVHNGRLVESPIATHGVSGRRMQALLDVPEGEDAGTFHAARHPDGTWTREGLEAVIRSGGSVLHNRDSVTDVRDLPDAAELAGTDPAKHEAVLDGLDRQIADLQAQRSAAERKRQAAERSAREQPRGEETGAPAGQERQAEPGAPSPQARDLPEGVPAHPGQPQLDEGEAEGRGRRHRR
jgi:hypothetical protein